MRENTYQAYLVELLKQLFPGCIVLKNDSSYIQGIPDLLVLYRDKWAMLEVKVSLDAKSQPNQQYYIDMANTMSFGAFIYPENEEDVLNELQQAFAVGRSARLSQR